MEQRLINKADLMDKIGILYNINGCKVFAITTDSINQLPTVELIKGEWIEKGVSARCSNCGCKDHEYYKHNFCPYCGADMRGGKE